VHFFMSWCRTVSRPSLFILVWGRRRSELGCVDFRERGNLNHSRLELSSPGLGTTLEVSPALFQ
jgi:hypothetical protein